MGEGLGMEQVCGQATVTRHCFAKVHPLGDDLLTQSPNRQPVYADPS